MTVDYAAILTLRYPGRRFSIGDTYCSLVADDDGPVPSEADLLALWPGVQAEIGNAAAQRQRQDAYASEADPLFFRWQAGEGTQDEWLAKREEIRQRYPYVGE